MNITKNLVLILFIFKISVLGLFAQNRNYYLFKNKELGISFKCPSSWIFKPDSIINDSEDLIEIDTNNGRFICIDKEEASEYVACYNGVIFHVEVNNKSLDSTILPDSAFIKKNSKYYGIGIMSNKPVEVENIKGKKWKGIYHRSSCRIHCKFGKEEGDEYDAITEGCEVIYFSNNNKTIGFSTSGRAFDKEVLRVIISSFRFIK